MSEPGCGRIVLSAFGFGAVARAEPGGPATVILRPGKPLAVLTFLHIAPGRSASREKLVDLLWSDVEPEAGRKQLRNALFLLRSRIGPWIVDDRDRACTLSADLESDVAAFAAAFADGCYARALDSYSGDFLTDFASPGATEFEHWAEAERARFRMMAASAAESCCREALDAGRFRDARAFVDRLRAIAPNSEVPWRLSLETAARGGDSIGAITEATRFEEWLRTEGREPEPASRAALRAVHDTPADASPRDVPGPTSRQLLTDLVGREAEFNAIVDAWRRARSGKPQLLFIRGGPGLGKTRLIDDLKRRFRFDRERAVAARAFPGERAVPFSFLVSFVHALARLPGATGVDANMVPTLLSIDPRLSGIFSGKAEPATLVDVISRRSLALNELLAAVCDEAAVPIFIDDYHWIDDSSRAVLASALSRVGGLRLLVAIASRFPPALGGGEFETTTLSLEPLSALDVENLIRSMGVLPSDDWTRSLVERLTASSSGNPLLVLVALQQLLDGSALAIQDGHWTAPDPTALIQEIERLDPIGSRLRSLSSDQLRVVLACAIAGMPLPRRALIRLGADSVSSSAAVVGAEQSGALVSADDTVDLAHDAIGEKAIEMADEPLRLDVQRTLAAALFDESDPRSIELGVRLAVGAGAFDTAAPSLARLVQTRVRETGQSVSTIVAAVLGRAPNEAVVRDAIRSLPLRVRVKPRRIAIAAIAAGMLALLSVRTLMYRPPPPDAVLELTIRDDPLHVRHADVPLRLENWNATAELSVAWGPLRQDTVRRAVYGAEIAPDRNVWMSTREDSAGVDVTLAGVNGEIERVTHSHADEYPGSWSPDGKQVTIQTSQFGDSGHKVIAILDMVSRRLRPLTGSRRWEGHPQWSPDGTRIALAPQLNERGTNAPCIYAVDGTRIRCDPPTRVTSIIGWIDDDRLLVRDGKQVVAERADDGTSVATGLNDPGDLCDLSPDGRWMWCNRSNAGALAGLQVLSTRDLERPRRVVSSTVVAAMDRPAWHWVGAHREYLDSVAVLAASDTIPLGAPSQIGAAGYSNLRREIRLHALRWISLDSTIARIDSTGTIHTLRQGRVTIEASAGGWRIGRRLFVVAERPTPTLLIEDWREPLTPRWQLFGIPLPIVVHDSLIGPAFLNNGDGNYFSGAYRIATPFDGHEGLALDAVVRIRVTREQWQYMNLGFTALRDVADLRKTWDHRTGYLPHQYEGVSCWFAYPTGEGARSALIAPGGDGQKELPRRPGARLPDIALGVPTRVRVQIFPDGRCGLALNGAALVINSASGPLDSLYLMTQGSSVDTQVLVGKLTVRRGVPRDVDWNHLLTRH
jgi:DNA-binding SARP family transcriptional activator